ncbi:MAG TPA: WYL domain-containing protein [Clostridia bacterium]|nr:WYL domain-containing protein [Clostridia bacterium]
MDKIKNSKLRLLHVLDILYSESDMNNILTMGDITRKLRKRGISGERRSVGRDIKILQEFGYDISVYEENRKGYYMASRELEDIELKILIDAVQSSKLITNKKSKELINKLQKLTSNHLAKTLQNQFYYGQRIKCENEKVYYLINEINEAIINKKKILFQYLRYDIGSRKPIPKKDGRVYVIHPYSMVWCADYYYLIGRHDKSDEIFHYRVDRMTNVKVLDIKAEFHEAHLTNGKFNIAKHINKIFNMYPGKIEGVDIKLEKSLLDTFIDRFGSNVYMRELDDKYIKISATVAVSDGFISWLLQFGPRIELLSPEKLREDLKNKAKKIFRIYE